MQFDADAATDDAGTPWRGRVMTDGLATVTTTTEGRDTSITLTNGVGEMLVNGEHVPVVAPYLVSWDPPGGHIDMIIIMGTSAHNVEIAYLYCHMGMTYSNWAESLDASLDTSNTSSNPCTFDMSGAHVLSAFTPFDSAPTDMRTVTTASVSGSAFNLTAGGEASITVDGLTWMMHPFNIVNCDAATCGGAGWYELHSLLYGPRGETAFTIAYLINDAPANISFGYSMRFDVPTRFDIPTLAASWSISAGH